MWVEGLTKFWPKLWSSYVKQIFRTVWNSFVKPAIAQWNFLNTLKIKGLKLLMSYKNKPRPIRANVFGGITKI